MTSEITESRISRRELLQLGSGGLAGGWLTTGAVIGSEKSTDGSIDIETLLQGKIDYTKAVATPTICFGCTTHCGVIGWVQDGRVRKMEGNPLDPNSKGNICSKAQGVITATYYPERLLYPLKRVGKRGAGKW